MWEAIVRVTMAVERWRLIKLVLQLRLVNHLFFRYNDREALAQLAGIDLVDRHDLPSYVLGSISTHSVMMEIRSRHGLPSGLHRVDCPDVNIEAVASWRRVLSLGNGLDSAADTLLEESKSQPWWLPLTRRTIQQYIEKPYHIFTSRFNRMQMPMMLPVVREYFNWMTYPDVREYQQQQRDATVAQLCFPEVGGITMKILSDLVTSHLDDGYEAL